MLLHHSPRSDVVMDDSRHSQLNDTIGYIFIGMTFELFFYGFSLAQTQYYFHVYPRDHKYLKALVAFLWLLDTVTACCDSSFLWYNVIDHHADIGSASHIIYTNAFNAEAFLSALIVLMTQLYFIYCIWRLMHGLIAPKWYHLSLILTMIAFALLSFCGGIACIYDMTQFPDETVLATADRTEVPALIQAVTAFVTDLFIAVALSIILHRKKTGFSRTDSVIAKLVIFAIQRGIITAYVADFSNIVRM
ncbi:hypothetical protein DAEQUDRAFT_460493 [Daedalea quercina L-15889]|uniref:DUF6534 domain-containing protein n=1 Tax=Daedalea quercina L-15889 TaxID=1314783 RepID=A0A165TCG3_9APHY|nr:hypothetical protein DAEQUDRAFT_460493 [Daedalea quercina L-15889]